ncbi:PH domain-containing protein [Labilithrix luteola]|nr:PH domain-containing protein [Labilithrix luteola]
MYDREHAVRTAHAPWARFAFLALMLVIAFGAFVGGVSARHSMLLTLLAGAVFIAASALSTGYVPRRVRAEDDELFVGDLHLPKKALERGCFVPAVDGNAAKVALKTKYGAEIDVRVTDEAEARELLSALGLDVGQQAARFAVARMPRTFEPAAWAISTSFATCAAVGASLLALGWPIPFIVIVIAIMARVLVPMARRGTVDVGADGVLLANAFGQRFHSWTDVTDLRAIDAGVELALRDGKMLPLRVHGRRRDPASQAEHVAMHARMSAARSAREEADVDLAPRLERRDQGIRAWFASLTRVATETDYRSAILRTEDLVRTLERHGSRVARVAAAIVLSQRGEVERERVRVIAGTCADPKLRVALDAVVAGVDEASLETAVEALEEEEANSSPARRGLIPRS